LGCSGFEDPAMPAILPREDWRVGRRRMIRLSNIYIRRMDESVRLDKRTRGDDDLSAPM
jgi:hypothetical protein